ncbi:MAG: hypothetical protein HWE27_04490 [Gammaproteobacteria bacterium]|nr:hypothetical protein [Gammaproteobacteria bacterium]
MNQKSLKIAVGSIVVLISMYTLSGYFWANGERLRVDLPSYFKVNGNYLALLFDNKVFNLNQVGKVNSIIDLDDFSIIAYGDFDFYSNGDLLIYHKNQDTSFLNSLFSTELKQSAVIKTDYKSDGFYRCSIAKENCERLEISMLTPNRIFRVVINKASNSIYLADSASDSLRILDENGNQIASLNTNLKYPREVLVSGNDLVIANTGRSNILISDLNEPSTIKEENDVNISRNYNRPIHIARTKSEWWVVFANRKIGNRIYRFDDSWQDRRKIELYDLNDPGDLVYFEEKIWVSGQEDFKIAQFNEYGTRLEFNIDESISVLLEEKKEQYLSFEALKVRYLVFFGLVLVVGFTVAFVLERAELNQIFNRRRKTAYDLHPIDPTPIEYPSGEGVYWLENRYRKNIYLKLIGILLILIFCFYITLSVNLSLKDWELPLSLLSISVFLILSLFLYQYFRYSKSKIGIENDQIIIDDGFGNVAAGQRREIIYSNRYIVIGKAAVHIGSIRYYAAFDPEELYKYVLTRLQSSEGKMDYQIVLHLIKNKHPLVLLDLVQVFFVIMFFSLLAFLNHII